MTFKCLYPLLLTTTSLMWAVSMAATPSTPAELGLAPPETPKAKPDKAKQRGGFRSNKARVIVWLIGTDGKEYPVTVYQTKEKILRVEVK